MRPRLPRLRRIAVFSIATYNFGDGPMDAKVRSLRRLAKRAAVISCQEAGDRGPAIDLFLAEHPTWRVYAPSVGAADHTPILFDRKVFRRRKRSATLAVAARTVGAKGAGPTRVESKYVVHLELVHRTNGAVVHVLNTHFIASVTRTREYLGASEWAARRGHFQDHVRAVERLVRSCKGAVFVTGDFNAEPDFELLAPARRALSGWSIFGTHGARNIDHVLHRPQPGLRVITRDALTVASDHRAVLATYSLRRPKLTARR